MKAYSIDLRERVLPDCDEGMPTMQVAAKLRVCASWVRRLKQRRRETGSIAPKAQRHGLLPRRAEQAGRVAEAIGKAPDATLDELRREHALTMSVASMWRLARDLDLTFKLKSLRATEQDWPDVKRLRDG